MTPKRVPFVYTNVKPEDGGEEGRAFQLNDAAIGQLLENEAVLEMLNAAGNGGLGRMGIDYKIDSVHHLRQTHSSWFERHIDTHSSGSLDFAIICMLDVENLVHRLASVQSWLCVNERFYSCMLRTHLSRIVYLKYTCSW